MFPTTAPTRNLPGFRPLLWAVSATLLAALGCESGGHGTTTVTVLYSGDTRAHGIWIETGGAAATTTESAVDGSCIVSSAAREAGCTAKIAASSGGLRLALYGCFLESGDALFDCDLPAERVRSLENEATVRAGCGCQSTCPHQAAITVCDRDDATCIEHLHAASGAALATDAPAIASTVTTRETTCSTCCDADYYPFTTGYLNASEPVAEFEMVVTFPKECEFDGWDSCDVPPSDLWSVVKVSGTSNPSGGSAERFCFSAADPDNVGDAPVLSCKDGVIDTIAFEHVAGADFTSAATTPSVRFD